MPDDPKGRAAAVINLHAATFTRAESYTKLIMVAGFGAFFALWSLVRTELPPVLGALAALSMVVSVASFVLFEVWKMMMQYRYLTPVAKAIGDNAAASDADFIEAVARAELAHQIKLARLTAVWVYALVPTLIFGVAAIGILIVALVQWLAMSLCS
jgi:hypothetical protein